jgi:Ca2+-dependent lipid-binding protein
MLHCNIKDDLCFELWDEDTLSNDDIMGKGVVNLEREGVQDGKTHLVTLPMEKGFVKFEITYTDLAAH